MPHFHTGHNMPGYMPMNDEPPYAYETFDDAKADLIDELKRAEDHYGMGAESYDRAEQMAEACCNAAEEVNLWSSPDAIHVCSDEPHDLGEVYWIVACSEDCENDE